MVSFPPRSQAPRCALLHRVKWPKFLKKICSVHHTVDSSAAMCIIPRSQVPRCASHCGVKLHSGARIKILESLWLLFKGTIRRKPFRNEHINHVRKYLKNIFWIWLALNFDSAMSCTPQSRILRTLWSNISAKSKPNLKKL